MSKQMTVTLDIGRKRQRAACLWVLVLCSALAMLPLACGESTVQTPIPAPDDEQILNDALRDIGEFTPVHLDTAALAHDARAGLAIQLPLASREGHGLGDREVQLTPRNLRSPDLTAFILKDGAAGSFSITPLPPSSTYQGKIAGGGVAVFTITDAVVEGCMLEAAEGWSFIEPLEPQLRLRNVEPGARQRLLEKYNHIVYNTMHAPGGHLPDDDPGTLPVDPGPPQPASPLVMSVVADGDVELLKAYPLDSVMPFWLKQETILNAIDWIYNCVEADANADNAYADCGNDFDGGRNNFQARVRIDRFEVWTTGGPASPSARTTLLDSTAMTHQAEPPCCGPPDTAGHASLVHFFSGKAFLDRAGEALGIGGVGVYDERCFDQVFLDKLCHHAVSQLVPSEVPEFTFHGTTFEQWMLVAHEIGHNNNGPENFFSSHVCWLFGEECGVGLMYSRDGFNSRMLPLYDPDVAQNLIGPRLAEQLEPAH